jgi:type III secretion protein L
MKVWLRNLQREGADAGQGIGVADDVLRGEHVAALVELDTAYREMSERCDAMLAAARDEAEAIVEDARAQAAELAAQAQADFDGAAQRGYDDGMRNALADWHARSVAMPTDARTPDERQRERLAELVALAVEQIVASSDPALLFARAASTVERIVADGSPVRVRVHPADLTAATAAFDAAAAGWRAAGRAVRLDVRADAALAAGACVCETDLGALDASLDLHLAAMRDALSRALGSVANGTGMAEQDEQAKHEAPQDAGETAPDGGTVAMDGQDPQMDEADVQTLCA